MTARPILRASVSSTPSPTLWTVALGALLLLGLAAFPASAQDRGGQVRVYENGDPVDGVADDDETNMALGLGAGVVEPDGTGEIYFSAGLRFRILDDRDDERSGDWRYTESQEIEAYLEPEVGYWEGDEGGVSDSDLLVGLNLIGVVPGRTVNYFFGVGLGVHFRDVQIDDPDQVDDVIEDGSDTNLGGNFQVGLDLQLGDSVAVFGVGRYDIVEGVEDTFQGKVYGGLRFSF